MSVNEEHRAKNRCRVLREEVDKLRGSGQSLKSAAELRQDASEKVCPSSLKFISSAQTTPRFGGGG